MTHIADHISDRVANRRRSRSSRKAKIGKLLKRKKEIPSGGFIKKVR